MMERSEPVLRPMTDEEREYLESGEWKKVQKLEDWEPIDD